jgi:hypothetical protein
MKVEESRRGEIEATDRDTERRRLNKKETTREKKSGVDDGKTKEDQRTAM